MIILDKPFVSKLLKQTIDKNSIPVLDSEYVKLLQLQKSVIVINDAKAIDDYNTQLNPLIYSNSENAINWITQNLDKTELPKKINIFKDKVKFRNLIKDLYPDFFYKEIDVDDIEHLNIDNIPKPFIIKPSVGFFSMGVYPVNSNEEWIEIPSLIKNEIAKTRSLYPLEVLDTGKFIIEHMIEGDEYAFDVYFNNSGDPIVLGIFKHIFASDDDVNDRVYYTSKKIIERYLKSFTDFSDKIGKRANLKNFPMHVEVRVDSKGVVVPIEANPMRFGGWCTTADLTTYAFNINPYEYYFNQAKPDWSVVLKDKDDLLYCIVILDNSTGYDANKIASFDYDAVLSRFKKPLDLRKNDWTEYPVFGFVFTETHVDNYNEIEDILKSDLREFVTLKD